MVEKDVVGNVALIIFNRPGATDLVFERIRAVRPKQLFVIADGPRSTAEESLCLAARAVIDRVDWDCVVYKNYSDVNLGVGVRPASGLEWVFEHVDEAIILEDDCLADRTFFRFCMELLEQYRHDTRIMHISGDNWRFTPVRRSDSYWFSRYCYSCGWATWKRAFQHYDPQMQLWATLRQTDWLLEVVQDAREEAFWRHRFDLILESGIKRNGWEHPWLFACWSQHALSILPSTNLIENIGFTPDATHTKSADDPRANVPTVEMAFPLRHPTVLRRDAAADHRIMRQLGLRPEDLMEKLHRYGAVALPSGLRHSLSRLRSH